MQPTTPEPPPTNKHTRLQEDFESKLVVDATVFEVGNRGYTKVASLTASGPPDPDSPLKHARSRPAHEQALAAPPPWVRPRSAPSAKITREHYNVDVARTVKRDWVLLEEPEEEEEEEETLESIARKEAKEAGRKMLEKGDEDGTALVDVADMADAENTWVPLPRGHTNAGGQAEMGWVVGFKSY